MCAVDDEERTRPITSVKISKLEITHRSCHVRTTFHHSTIVTLFQVDKWPNSKKEKTLPPRVMTRVSNTTLFFLLKIYEIVLLDTIIRPANSLDFQANQLFYISRMFLVFSLFLARLVPGWKPRYIPEVGGLFTPVANFLIYFEKMCCLLFFSILTESRRS